MIINIVILNKIPNNGSMIVTFPSTSRWAQDLTLSHLIPIINNLSCSLLNSTNYPYLSSVSCQSSAGQSVQITPIYNNNATTQQL